jgi:hypothetical protein
MSTFSEGLMYTKSVKREVTIEYRLNVAEIKQAIRIALDLAYCEIVFDEDPHTGLKGCVVRRTEESYEDPHTGLKGCE